MPKTGSTFARRMLRKIHAQYDNALPRKIMRKMNLISPSLIELMLPIIYRKHDYGVRGQHSTYRQIPDEHKHKTVVTITRNPFEGLVSAYLFGWETKFPFADVNELKTVFPNWPNLSFAEYYRMINTFIVDDYMLDGISLKIPLGILTIQFVDYYFEDPKSILNKIDEEYLAKQSYRNDMPKIVFLHQENLNQELYGFLLKLKYPRSLIDPLVHEEKINVTPRKDDQRNISNFYTPEIVEDILNRDRMLFDLFPQYRVLPLKSEKYN